MPGARTPLQTAITQLQNTQVGCEIAGMIKKVGNDVQDFHTGDPVYGYLSLQRNGGYAEYTIAKSDEIAPKSESNKNIL